MRYAKIDEYEVVNGLKNGMSLYVQGCHFNCQNCFNVDSHDFNEGKEWNEEAKMKFYKLADRPYIKRISILGGEPLADENVYEVLNIVEGIKNKYYNTQYIVCENKDKHNILNEKPNEIRLSLPQKDIWLYTGYVADDFLLGTPTTEEDKLRAEIVKLCDVVVDGRYIDSLRDITLRWRGSSNQKVIDVKKTLEQNKIVLYCD